MKSFPNVLRIIVLDPPSGYEPKLESKRGAEAGIRNAEGHVVFETPYACKQNVEGPAVRQENERQWSVYVGWYDARGKRRGRLKIPLGRVPNLAWDSEITVCGREGDEPVRGMAEIWDARNIDDYLDAWPPID